MSARDNLHAAIVIAAARGRCNEEGITRLIDAFHAEVLREAAEKIRKAPFSEHLIPAHHKHRAAQIIDPEVME